jgi:hypothetical protein
MNKNFLVKCLVDYDNPHGFFKLVKNKVYIAHKSDDNRYPDSKTLWVSYKNNTDFFNEKDFIKLNTFKFKLNKLLKELL